MRTERKSKKNKRDYIYIFLYQATTNKILLKPLLSSYESKIQILLAQKEINKHLKSNREKLGSSSDESLENLL